MVDVQPAQFGAAVQFGKDLAASDHSPAGLNAAAQSDQKDSTSFSAFAADIGSGSALYEGVQVRTKPTSCPAATSNSPTVRMSWPCSGTLVSSKSRSGPEMI